MASGYPNFDTLDFDSIKDQQGLFEHIQCITRTLYKPICKNIAFLAKRNNNVSYVQHIVALRDAYSHLCKAVEYDIHKPEEKIKIKRQLERYLGHLEELLYDSYLKIIKLEIAKVLALFNPKDKDSQNRMRNKPKTIMGLAVKVQQARMMDDKIPINVKIARYDQIIKDIESDYDNIRYG